MPLPTVNDNARGKALDLERSTTRAGYERSCGLCMDVAWCAPGMGPVMTASSWRLKKAALGSFCNSSSSSMLSVCSE